MKTALQLSFNVDKENKKIIVNREFNAPLSKVWDAWTKSELLDQWWAPKPWQAKTRSQNFTDGGSWFYSMQGPNNEEHWARADYSSIVPKKKFSVLDAFTDPQGNINMEMPRSNWEVSFEIKDASTMVNITITYDKAEDLQKYIDMGFKEGFTMGMENLDTILEESGI